jgi:exonuclease SbcD
MRLLHTSDWHLGQTLHQFERSHEHAAFLAWLLDTLEAEAVDALLIAGDVFDNANPSSQSQTQLYRFLTEARRRVPWLNIVIIAGNHDSPGRLEAPLPFLALLDAHVVGQTVRTAGRWMWSGCWCPSRAGMVVEAWCMAMPFCGRRTCRGWRGPRMPIWRVSSCCTGRCWMWRWRGGGQGRPWWRWGIAT